MLTIFSNRRYGPFKTRWPWAHRTNQGRHSLQLSTQNNILCNRNKEFSLNHLGQIFGWIMGELSREQEQPIARSTLVLFAALLSILMFSIAWLFLSAELEQHAQKKAETSVQIAHQLDVAPKPK